MAFTEKYTIICDEVRREDNGKILILGMYIKAIVVSQLPAVLPSLTFFQVMEADRPGQWNMKMKIQHLESGRPILQAGGVLNAPQIGPFINVLRFPNLPLIAVGAYNFSMEIEDHREPLIVPFDVILNIPQGMQGPPGGAPGIPGMR